MQRSRRDATGTRSRRKDRLHSYIPTRSPVQAPKVLKKLLEYVENITSLGRHSRSYCRPTLSRQDCDSKPYASHRCMDRSAFAAVCMIAAVCTSIVTQIIASASHRCAASPRSLEVPKHCAERRHAVAREISCDSQRTSDRRFRKFVEAASPRTILE